MYRKILNWLLKKVDKWINKLINFKKTLSYLIYMDDFGYKKSDIYVVTYPRSGTTLLQMMLYQITTDGNFDFNHLYDISPWIKNDVFEGISANKELKTPRLIKSHDTYKEFDKLISGKIIFVIRDGLDAMYSLYRQKVDYGNPDLTLDKFSKGLIKDNSTKWFHYNKHWLENKRNNKILFLTYNELANNKKETINKICSFLKLDINTVNFERVIERTSLKFMKKHMNLFGERVSEDNKNFDYSKFIRKGESGEGEKEFNNEIKRNYYKDLEKLTPLLNKYNLKI